MADVIITLKIMPTSPNVDLKKIEELALKKIIAFAELDNYKVEEEPLAFGLKALKILFVMNEAKGGVDDLEKDLNTIDGVNSVETTDVRRALG